ncbi:type-F conjugative transfer system secretin TraK [Nissabacter sp. SGAir0207]|uniref:type-F conjugative transfer system secretin TraK n=1 Tax=Nissabacter sp. SGAir0207 TaxID=2126321 RepID=UPI0010CD370C|nr:type-F conjugative transfer system secretin TraK [Nissabacter sp. SGAir0207]QCR38920.1 type-F conjugative transfer system secretin TraK [Nissabacter sp. SGAir0207]
MMPRNKWLAALLACVPCVSWAVTAPVSLSFPPNGQFDLPVSNTNPNLIVVPGDRIVAVNSAVGTLTDKRNTKEGAALLSTLQEKPFTFYLETEHGQVFSINARPAKGAGRSYRLSGQTAVHREEARKWETAQPYETTLIALNKALRQGRMPAGYAGVPADRDTLKAPLGLQVTAETAWSGDALRVVRARITNLGTLPAVLREQDFWQPGVRAVMFDTLGTELPGGATAAVYVTLDQEAGDEH